MYRRSVVWLRRDLRLSDNAALYHACRKSAGVVLAFVVNPPLIEGPRMGAPLVAVFFDALANLRADLRRRGSDLAIVHGEFAPSLLDLCRRLDAAAVFYNVDYEPHASRRDAGVTSSLEAAGIAVEASLDHVYFGADEVTQLDGRPYRIFTPYKRRWLDQRALSARHAYASEAAVGKRLIAAGHLPTTDGVPTLQEFGMSAAAIVSDASEAIAAKRLQQFLRPGGAVEGYARQRNFPAEDGTSRLSAQLRAGTIGIRTCVESAFRRAEDSGSDARADVDVWISELVWRDFYQMILKRFPRVADSPFLPAAQRIVWRDARSDFDAWATGRTGYPIVDAAMRQLTAFGWMHNRLRMLTASFLTKHLLVDWRLGESHFERHLADADLAANNGGWQWAASTGTDAVPYFRIFNPILQSRRFDPDGRFIKNMLPELNAVPPEFVHAPWTMPPAIQAAAGVTIGDDYPAPIVDHAAARVRAIRVYAAAFRDIKAV